MENQVDSTKDTFGGYELDSRSVQLLPHVFCITNNVVVLGKVNPKGSDPVHLGISNPARVDVIDLVSMKFGGRLVSPVELRPEQITKAISRGFGFGKLATGDLRVEEAAKQAAKASTVYEAAPKGGAKSKISGLESVDLSEDEDRPIIELVNSLLLDALRRGATDIHIENERKMVQVRFKLDGMLYKVPTGVHKDNVDEVVSRIKVMSSLDISEHRAPQDGRILFRTLRNGQDYDVPFRISILPGPYGEEVVLRVLDKSMAPINLELLGFTSGDLKLFRQLIKNPQGMILVTGPTGAGKTTTLYAVLKEINTPFNKIISAEDPIEYNLDGVNQKQIDTKFDFADMARAFLRHDPDIILIGEIRDQDTADVACKAAQTGHLILSTIHTNDSISTIARLQSLGVTSNLIASTMICALSQRLVRRICPKCQAPYTPSDDVLRLFKDHFSLDKFTAGQGCSACHQTGFQERIGIFELFYVDDELQDMIQLDAPLGQILNTALIKGMVPLTLDGLAKVEQGLTTLDELIRVIPRRQIVAQLQRRYEEV